MKSEDYAELFEKLTEKIKQLYENKIKEIENNLIKNDNKLENVNKAIEEIMSKNNKDQNTTEIYNSKMNVFKYIICDNILMRSRPCHDLFCS